MTSAVFADQAVRGTGLAMACSAAPFSYSKPTARGLAGDGLLISLKKCFGAFLLLRFNYFITRPVRWAFCPRIDRARWSRS